MSNSAIARCLIQSASDMTKIQKLSFNALLHIAKKQLDDNLDRNIFTTSFSEIKEVLGNEKKINNADLGRNLDGLTAKNIIINILENNEYEHRNAMGIVSELRTFKDYKVEFIFPPTIRKNIIMPKMFCPFDLKFEARLSSRYSITLYEYCKDYIKVEIPKLEINTFKKLLGVEGGYDRIFDIRHKVIEKSIKDINAKTDITITKYELIKQGSKKIKYVKFWAEMKDNPPPPPKDAEDKDNIGNNEPEESFEELSEELELIPDTEKLTTKQKKELTAFVLKHGHEIVKSNILYTNNQKYVKYYSYLKKAIKEDFAESDRLKEKAIQEKAEAEKAEALKSQAAEQEKETERAEALKVFDKLGKAEKKEIEEKAETELKASPIYQQILKTPEIYKAMKNSKISELTKLKYGKIKSLASALTETRQEN